MKTSFIAPLCIAILLLTAAQVAHAQSIYKCTKGGQIEYTDRPCPGNGGQVIHLASDQEIIDQYLDLGQIKLAKSYADTHHLDTLYQQRLAAYQLKLADKARQEKDAAIAAQQSAAQAQQQAVVAQAAQRNQLLAQNNLLREQNQQYHDQLTTPVVAPAPVYYGGAPRYGHGYGQHGNDHGHDHDHDHDGDHGHHSNTPTKPVFHPCTQMAGGRVTC